MSQDEQQQQLVPRFALSEGAGVALGTLPCFTAVSTRGAAGKALESALEPVHRIVYGRPGTAGKRRSALVAFQGFPAAMEAEVVDKVAKLTKDRLRDLIKALDINVYISLTHAEVAAGVAKFLMAPRDDGRIKDASAVAAAKEKAKKAAEAASRRGTAAAPSASSSAAAAGKGQTRGEGDADDEPLFKKVKADVSGPSGAPSDDAVLVQVYRRVLAMTPEDRALLGVKALRTSLEDHFALPAGGLRDRKEIITTAASDCVRALKEAEMRAAGAAQASGDAPGTASTAATEASAPAQPVAPPPHPVGVPMTTASPPTVTPQ